MRPISSSSARRYRHANEASQLLLPFQADAQASVNSASKEQADGTPSTHPRRMSAKTLGSQKGDAQERRGLKRTKKHNNPRPPARAVIPSEDEPPTRRKEALEEASFLRLREVKAFTSLGKTSIYEMIRDRSFPAPVRLGPRSVAWVRSELRQWAAERVHASRSAA